MAYSYTFPGSLPQMPDTNYTETGGVLILRSPVDAGPAKQRKRGNRPQVLQLTYTMSPDQVVIFENFVKNTLNGTARFGMTHPRLLTVIEARIIPQSGGDLYTISYINPTHYSVNFSVEILP